MAGAKCKTYNRGRGERGERPVLTRLLFFLFTGVSCIITHCEEESEGLACHTTKQSQHHYISGSLMSLCLLILLLIISIPFKRISMGLINPLPKSVWGHRYIQVMMDYVSLKPTGWWGASTRHSKWCYSALYIKGELNQLLTYCMCSSPLVRSNWLCNDFRQLNQNLRVRHISAFASGQSHYGAEKSTLNLNQSDTYGQCESVKRLLA